MADTEKDLISKAVADGYPDVDEICAECSAVFKNYQHFIRCERVACPMKDGKGTLLEQLKGGHTMKCPHCDEGMSEIDHGLCSKCDRYCGCSFSPTTQSDYCLTHKPKRGSR